MTTSQPTEYVLANTRVLRPDGGLASGAVRISDGLIADVRHSSAGFPAEDGTPVVDLQGRILAPGLVDTHVHGALGHNVMSGDRGAMRTIGTRLRDAGTTSFVAATATVPFDDVERSVRAIASLTGPTGPSGADLLGLHLEGPFLSPEFRGVHPAEHLVPPDPVRVGRLLDAAAGRLRICTIAPELPGAEAAIRRLADAGTRVSVGHTGADFGATVDAIRWGASRATHLFNAMPPLHHRAPGPVPALLADERVYYEIVADGVHVAADLLGALVRAPGLRERAVLVSDGTDVSGLPDGDHRRWEGTPVRIVDGRAYTQAGGVAGSTSTVLDGVRLLVEAGVPLGVALNAGARNPARSLGLADRGEVTTGLRADLIVVDDDATINATIMHGQWESRREDLGWISR